MRNTFHRLAFVALMPSLLAVAGCRTNTTGLSFDSVIDASQERKSDAAQDLPPGSGGKATVDGPSGSGGDDGSGGSSGGSGGYDGSGGAGSGGSQGSGGVIGSGGTGSGGSDGSGGVVGSGGVSGSGGYDGSGGAVGSGGAGSGGTPYICDASSCNGCCVGNTCVAQVTNAQCGKNGGACLSCSACEQCSEGACRVKASSTWQVTCASAVIATERPGYGLWDPAGTNQAPDPLCSITADGTSADSSIDYGPWPYGGTFAPTWNAAGAIRASKLITAAELMAMPSAWNVAIIDCDGMNCQTRTVACTVSRAASEAELQSGAFTASNVDGCVSVQLGLVCLP